jgi:hypothetical protein
LHHRFGDAIGNYIANNYIKCELNDRPPPFFMEFESKILIKEITDNAAKEIVGC